MVLGGGGVNCLFSGLHRYLEKFDGVFGDLYY